jgi:hypothetical protein
MSVHRTAAFLPFPKFAIVPPGRFTYFSRPRKEALY